MDIEQSLSRYLSGYTLLKNQLNKLSQDAIYYKPTADSWSINEIIAHIADAEAHGYVMAKKIIAESGGRVCVYNQEIWSQHLFYDKMNYKDALEQIHILRKNLYEVLRLIPPNTWDYYIYHPDSGKITLTEWIMFYIDHIDIHIRQIQQNSKSWSNMNKREKV